MLVTIAIPLSGQFDYGSISKQGNSDDFSGPIITNREFKRFNMRDQLWIVIKHEEFQDEEFNFEKS